MRLGIHYSHCDAQVVRTIVVKNRLSRMLVDDGSVVNILFDDSLILQGRIILAVDFGELLCHMKKFIEFLVVDTFSIYHRVFGRPVLKDLQLVTWIHHLAKKLLTSGRVAMIQDNQIEARVCYIMVLRKAKTHEKTAFSIMMVETEAMEIEKDGNEEDMVFDEGLDPQITVHTHKLHR
ncbi:Uncharacterized protein Adt_48111 [Abeliophyllum distichum]|uniref:Uncharacterized protein n=1 Tax=Abeliophyllum distichum TaxID=126358 RepID=A0ABD1NTX1_9LAMI